jgi:plastocyanin
VGTWRYKAAQAFSPSVIEISSGTTVTWTNEDTIIHTVTDIDGSFDSYFIQAGETWEHTFDSKDTYYYFCSIHPWMKGAVIVV